MSETVSKRIYHLSAVAIVALVLIGVLAARPILPPNSTAATTARTLQVNGVGTASASPDQVLLSLAVNTQSATATQATQDNAAAMARLIQALENAGIGTNSISTVSYTLTPVYDNKPDQSAPPTLIGYSVRNAIQVTLNDTSLTGKTLDLAVQAGANEVGGVTFTFSNPTYASLQKQALQLAVQDASSQAQTMAAALGVHLLSPTSVSTGYYYQPTVERMASANAVTPIQPGTLQVTANVQITYEISST